MEGNFQLTDWVVFLGMLLSSVVIGMVTAVRGRHNASTQEYLLGGRHMPPIAVAMSLLGGMVSAATILGNATELYFYGAQIAVILLGYLVGMIFFIQSILPVLYNLQLVSVCEYMQYRFNSAVLRKATTLGFLLAAFIPMSMNLYAPSLALATVTNIPTHYAMIAIGAIVTFYITIGGVKAVVYTDVLQTLVIIIGLLAVVVLCGIDLGGISKAWVIAEKGGRLEIFNMDTNPYERHTFWSTFVLGVASMFTYTGMNQVSFQRYASVGSLKTAKWVGWMFVAGCWSIFIIIYIAAIFAYATYSTCDPLTSRKIRKPDQILPFLVTDKLGHIPGITGLFVAAVYGGVLSTLSASSNSVACLVWEDFLKPISFFSRFNDSSATITLKLLSIVTGTLVVGLGMLMGSLGTIFNVQAILLSTMLGPPAGLFLTGIFLPWVNFKGAISGFLAAVTFCAWRVVTTFLNGEGVPVPKSLSVAGCPPSFNDTLEMPSFTKNENESKQTLESLSYCYIGAIAIILVMVVSGVAGLLTGPICPSKLPRGVVNPTCEQLYKQVWQRCRANKISPNTDVTNKQDA